LRAVEAMDLSEFRRRVREYFGPSLSRATPANVREFVDSLYAEIWRREHKPGVPVELGEEGVSSFEEAVKEFFDRVLDYPPDQAVIALWLVAIDLYFSAIEESDKERFAPLFGEDSAE